MLVTNVVLRHTPALPESVDGRLTETGLTENLDVTVTGRRTRRATELSADCGASSAALVVPGFLAEDTRVTGDPEVEVSNATWLQKPALRIAVVKGRTISSLMRHKRGDDD